MGCLVVLVGCNKVSVRFEVKVHGNPESVFIVGDHQELGIWNPGEVEMKKTMLLIIGVFLISCGASIPSWYSKLPDEKGYRYAVGTERGD